MSYRQLASVRAVPTHVSRRLIYTLVQGHIRKLEGLSPEVDELAAEAVEQYSEEAPLLGPDTNHA